MPLGGAGDAHRLLLYRDGMKGKWLLSILNNNRYHSHIKFSLYSPPMRLWITKLHWLLGISLGVVLAVMGVTGASLSFESEVMHWLNRDVREVPAIGHRLTATELMESVRERKPEPAILGLRLFSEPHRAAQVGFVGGRRGEWQWVNPYTGDLLGEGERGHGFFSFMEDTHRRLLAGDTGKAITGAAAIALIFFCLSGLYLRWPKLANSWRIWWRFDYRKSGRGFWREMHVIFGTWLLLFYLLAALTGLFWSYEWYRDALYQISGTEKPQRAANTAKDKMEPSYLVSTSQLTQAMEHFARETEQSEWQNLLIRFPDNSANAQWEFRYLPASAEHPSASNTLVLSPELQRQKHERYNDLTSGQQLLRSVLVLHTGRYFGYVGVVLMMLASIAMPVFAISGWWLYLDRRKKEKKLAEVLKLAKSSSVPSENDELKPDIDWIVGYASQTGQAEALARQTAESLRALGLIPQVFALSHLPLETLQRARHALFVVSTHGEGEPPDNALHFARRFLPNAITMTHLRFAVLALGDRQYEQFCAFGKRLDTWLSDNGARSLFGRVELDQLDVLDPESEALAQWTRQIADISSPKSSSKAVASNEHHLGSQVKSRAKEITSGQDINHAESGRQAWTLSARELLNANSLGQPMYRIALVAHSAVKPWQAGDLLDVLPTHTPASLHRYANAVGWDLDSAISTPDNHVVPVREWLMDKELPALQMAQRLQFPSGLRYLLPLKTRAYSIASIPEEGSLDLLVRAQENEGRYWGAASGWLTQYAEGSTDASTAILGNIREHHHFRDTHQQRPMILIGNGSGWSALRAHVATRAKRGGAPCWVVLGERQRQCDFYYQHEWQQWVKDGVVEHLDLAFSRDQSPARYVQHILREQQQRLRAWLAKDAQVFVCGSLKGMGTAVHQTLLDLLSEDYVLSLMAEGRYRRDIY